MSELKTKLEEVSPVKKRIEVAIPAERVKAVLEEEYKKMARKTKVKGFRKGKVPRNLLEQYYAEDVHKEVVERLVRESYSQALEIEMAAPISAPYVEPGPFDKDKPFTYTAIFEVRPVVEVGEFAGLRLEKPEVVVTEEEIDNHLKMIQQQMTQLEPLPDDAKAEKGMVLIVDFRGTADGKKFEGSMARDFMVELGGGSLLPQLEGALCGMSKGEEKDFELDYPADYFNKELAGKRGAFHVRIKEIKKKIVPELTDEFAKDLGNFKSLDDVKKDIEKRILAAKEQEVKRILSGQVLEQLVEGHRFEVPESMINSELKAMFEGFVRYLATQHKKFEDTGMTLEQFIEKYRKEAENRVKSFLVVEAIAEIEKINISEEEIEARLKLIAQQAGQPFPKVRQQYESKNLIPGLRIQLRHERAIDLIIDRAKIKVKKAKKAKKES